MSENKQEDIVIEIKDLVKKYKMYNRKQDRLIETIFPKTNKHTDFTAINHLDLTIKKGEVVGILGKNGAGKSTLLKIITGVVVPTSGEVKINGKISSLLELGAAFNMDLTGEENIYQNGQVMGLTAEEIENSKQKIIDFADIGDHIYQPVKTYSSGMFARLAFACAINVNPDILIVDEVLSVGDIAFQLKCINEMKKMIKKGITILYVSHSTESVMSLCNRAIWLKDGKIYMDGDVKEVTKKYNVFMTHGYLEDKDKKEGESKDIEIEKPKNISKVGNGKAFISKFNYSLIKDGDTAVDEWEENQELTLTVETNEDIENPLFGFTINHSGGLPIFHYNTFLDREKIPPLKANKKYKVHLRFRIPNLNTGKYGVSFSLDDGVPGMADIVCRMDNVLIFSVVQQFEDKQFGIIYVDEKDVEVEEI